MINGNETTAGGTDCRLVWMLIADGKCLLFGERVGDTENV